MSEGPQLRTDRLILRCWSPKDRTAFAAMNANPRVMEFLGEVLSREQSDALADRIEARFDRQGFGFWAVEIPSVAPFIGFVGLNVPTFVAPFTPAVEVGWRLDPAFWGCGYASEAALAAVGFAFDFLKLDEVVAFTTARNTRSRHVMERIGMTHDVADDFDHPLVPMDSPLRAHVLYRTQRPAAGKQLHDMLDGQGVSR